MDDLFKDISKEELVEKTGIQTIRFNIMSQLFSVYNSRNFNISNNNFILMSDYLRSLLSGNKNTEYTIFSTTDLNDQIIGYWL